MQNSAFIRSLNRALHMPSLAFPSTSGKRSCLPQPPPLHPNLRPTPHPPIRILLLKFPEIHANSDPRARPAAALAPPSASDTSPRSFPGRDRHPRPLTGKGRREQYQFSVQTWYTRQAATDDDNGRQVFFIVDPLLFQRVAVACGRRRDPKADLSLISGIKRFKEIFGICR